MSYRFWGMAVRAEQAAVLEALRRWPNEQEARLAPCSDDVEEDEEGWLVFAMAPHGAWTVFSFHFEQRLIPELALHLSRTLGTRVISVDQNASIGYEHFSVIDAGSVSRVFTLDCGDQAESIGVDTRDFYEQAKRSNKIRLSKYREEDEEIEMTLNAFTIFNLVVSDINVEEIAAGLEEPIFRLWAGDIRNRALATLTQTGRGQGPWWKDLT